MLIVLSSEDNIENEGAICNELFRCGLPLLHLRKPKVNKNNFRNLLLSIDHQYHPKITIHQYHDLKGEFNIGGIHYTENHRISRAENLDLELKIIQKEGLRTSTSIHSKDSLGSPVFDYYFFSPVFDSISKKKYAVESYKNRNVPIVFELKIS